MPKQTNYLGHLFIVSLDAKQQFLVHNANCGLGPVDDAFVAFKMCHRANGKIISFYHWGNTSASTYLSYSETEAVVSSYHAEIDYLEIIANAWKN